MEITSLLLLLLFGVFSLPCLLLLLVLLTVAGTWLATIVLRPDTRTQYTRPSRTAFLGCRIPHTSHDSTLDEPLLPESCGKLAATRYRRGAHGPAPTREEEVDCVFCLSSIEEGEEVRELRCSHLFHKACLDGWLVRPRATCPLCRDRLLPGEVVTPCSDEAEEEMAEQEVFAMTMASYVHSRISEVSN